MSRVGKLPVVVPAGVEVSVKDSTISVKGTGGTLQLTLNSLVTLENAADKLSFKAANDSREADAMSGTMRQLVNNMVLGVTKGFEKKLNLVGVGYKAQANGNKLNLAVGYSHPVNFDMPVGITVTTPTPTEILIKGADRQREVKSPLKFVLFVRQSPIRAKAFAMRTKRSRSKKPRRNKELQHVDQKRAASSQSPSNSYPHRRSRRCTVDGQPH